MTRAFAVLAFVAAGLVGAAPPAPAQSSSPSVRLVSQTAWLADGDSFDLLLGIEGDADDAHLVVTVHDRLGSRSAFVQSLEGRARGTTAQVRLAIDSVPVDADGNRRISLALPAVERPAATATLPDIREGVYPVSVALRGDDGDTDDDFMTHLVRLPDDDALAPLTVSWIQPIGAPPALSPTDAVTGDDREALRHALRALTLDPTAPMTLEATPETVQRLGEADLQPLREAVDRGSQLLTRPYVDVDPNALVAAGVAADLAAQRQVGEDVLFATLGTRGDPRTWTADQPLATRTVARLRELGVTRLVVPEASLEPLDDDVTGGITLTRPFELSAGNSKVVRALAIEEGLLQHFRSGTDQVLAAHQFLADLAVLFFDFPGTARGVAVRPPPSWQPSGAFLGTVLPAMADVPILRMATLDELFDGVEPLDEAGDTVVRSSVSTTRGNTLPAARLAAAHAAIDEVAALIGPGAELIDELRLRVLVSESTDVRPADRNRLLASVLTERAEIEGRIQLLDQRSFRLTAREGTIPLTLTNDNSFPVTVDLLLSSDKLEFIGAPPRSRGRHVLRIDLEPGTHTRTVPVRTRASGTFQVRASLLSTGGDVIRRGQFTITSSAFSGVGVVLSIGAGLFLLLWWARHWRTVRRDQRLVEPPK